jgi:hypothetical protein
VRPSPFGHIARLCMVVMPMWFAGAGAVAIQAETAASRCAPAEVPRRYDPRLSVSLNALDDYPQLPAISRSPDGRWAAWVTHCVDLARNRNVYTLWVYDLGALRLALRHDAQVPQPAFSLSREAWESEPGISGLQWSGDGRRLAFLTREGLSHDRIETLDLASGATSVTVDSPARILAYRQVPSGTVYARAATEAVSAQAARA